jgi:hypothetical protein
MIHNFREYPAGLTGGGLFVLRVSVAISAMCLVVRPLDAHSWLAWPMAAIILAGYRSRLFLGIWLCICFGLTLLDFQAGPDAVPILNSLASWLLGPGAISVDAWRFGRRELFI